MILIMRLRGVIGRRKSFMEDIMKKKTFLAEILKIMLVFGFISFLLMGCYNPKSLAKEVYEFNRWVELETEKAKTLEDYSKLEKKVALKLFIFEVKRCLFTTADGHIFLNELERLEAEGD
jgi:hypothetical protein